MNLTSATTRHDIQRIHKTVRWETNRIVCSGGITELLTNSSKKTKKPTKLSSSKLTNEFSHFFFADVTSRVRRWRCVLFFQFRCDI